MWYEWKGINGRKMLGKEERDGWMERGILEGKNGMRWNERKRKKGKHTRVVKRSEG